MDAITTWAKDNFDLITLFVGVIGVVLAVISLIYEIRKKKSDLRSRIAEKQAELDALDSIHFHMDMTSAGNSMTRRAVLQKEIEALKKKL